METSKKFDIRIFKFILLFGNLGLLLPHPAAKCRNMNLEVRKVITGETNLIIKEVISGDTIHGKFYARTFNECFLVGNLVSLVPHPTPGSGNIILELRE